MTSPVRGPAEWLDVGGSRLQQRARLADTRKTSVTCYDSMSKRQEAKATGSPDRPPPRKSMRWGPRPGAQDESLPWVDKPWGPGRREEEGGLAWKSTGY